MDEFKLEVGGEYVDGRGELHTCTEDAGVAFLCVGVGTGPGYYNADGTLFGLDSPNEFSLRPIPE